MTLTKNPEPKKNTKDWVIWAAWADRITFEEIHKKTGLRENGEVVAWGHNLAGQCDVPPNLGKVIDITAGAFFTIALKEDGTNR